MVSLDDMYHSIARMAAEYLPREALISTDIFNESELEGAVEKPKYHVNLEQSAFIERLAIFVKDRKKGRRKGKMTRLPRTESLVKAVAEDLPALLKKEESLVSLAKPSVRRFFDNSRKEVLDYFNANESRLQNQYKAKFDAAKRVLGTDKHVIDERILSACNRRLDKLDAEIHKNAALEHKNDELERKRKGHVKREHELEQEKQDILGSAKALKERYSRLKKSVEDISAGIDSIKEQDAQIKTAVAEMETKYSDFEEENAELEKTLKIMQEKAVKDNKGIQTDLDQAIQYKEAEVKDLQERVMLTERELDKEKLASAELDVELKMAKAAYEGELGARRSVEDQLDNLKTYYAVKITQLGESVAKWYAFSEGVLEQMPEIDSEQIQGLLDANNELAEEIAGLLKETRGGKAASGLKYSVGASWDAEEPQPEFSVPDAEGIEKKVRAGYDAQLEKLADKNRRLIWGWMHALDTEQETPADLRQEVYEAFLDTGPADHMIRGVAHCNLGTIFAEKADYDMAQPHYEAAVRCAEKEIAVSPDNEEAEGRLERYKANLERCKEKAYARKAA